MDTTIPKGLVKKAIHVKLRFTAPVLGTQSGNPEIQTDYISSKIPSEGKTDEEVAARRKAEVDAILREVELDEEIEKTKTVFPRFENGQPFMWDYMIRGYFKEAAKARWYAGDKLSAYRMKIDLSLFVRPVQVPLVLPPRGMVGECQRPLRASTPQGERVALANSEEVPEGTTMEFVVLLTMDGIEGHVRKWLDYGALHGMGQWRNSGKGTFVYSAYDEKGKYLYGTDPEHD